MNHLKINLIGKQVWLVATRPIVIVLISSPNYLVAILAIYGSALDFYHKYSTLSHQAFRCMLVVFPRSDSIVYTLKYTLDAILNNLKATGINDSRLASLYHDVSEYPICQILTCIKY